MLQDAVGTIRSKSITDFVRCSPAQAAVVGLQVMWTEQVERAFSHAEVRHVIDGKRPYPGF